MDVLNLNLPHCCHISLSYIMGVDIEMIHKGIQTTCSHASHCHYCHYCNVDFVLFHNVTCCTNSLLSHIYFNTVDLLNIMCTLVARGMILGRLELIPILYSPGGCVFQTLFFLPLSTLHY